MQAKDIDLVPILELLAEIAPRWGNWSDAVGEEWYARSVRKAMPAGLPPKLVLAKMRTLIRRGLVTGCTCGCRGDFEITAKGLEALIKRVQALDVEDGLTVTFQPWKHK